MTVATELLEYLIAGGVGATIGVDMFRNKIPSEVDIAVGVVSTGGGAPSVGAPTKELSYQILVRHTSYESGMQKANMIRELLHVNETTDRTMYKLTTGGTLVFESHALQEPYNLGQDENGRYEIVSNYQFLIA